MPGERGDNRAILWNTFMSHFYSKHMEVDRAGRAFVCELEWQSGGERALRGRKEMALQNSVQTPHYCRSRAVTGAWRHPRVINARKKEFPTFVYTNTNYFLRVSLVVEMSLLFMNVDY